MSGKPKIRKCYYRIPLTKNRKSCPVCQTEFVTSKLMIAFYDAFNENIREFQEKLHFCNSCHVPYVTEEEKAGLESGHGGFHIETVLFRKGASRESLQKLSGIRALPVRNVPKGEFLFIGEPKNHACGKDVLVRYQGLFHGPNGQEVLDIHECTVCRKKLIQPMKSRHAMKCFPDYFYMDDASTWQDLFPYRKWIYLLNLNQYSQMTCPKCGNRLEDVKFHFKNDSAPKMQPKSLKQCKKCESVFARCTSFQNKPYGRYRFSMEYFREEPFRENGKRVVLKSGDFLTRHNLSGCISRGHSLEDITAVLRIADPDGEEIEYDAPAVRCDTCGRLFLLESEYERIVKLGVPLCPIVENEYWKTDPSGNRSFAESDAKGSILYLNGYNVNAQNSLTEKQRQEILETLISDGTVAKAEAMSHLDTLIRRAGNQEPLKAAKTKWLCDRAFLQRMNENKETENDVWNVQSITRSVYRKRTGI